MVTPTSVGSTELPGLLETGVIIEGLAGRSGVEDAGRQ